MFISCRHNQLQCIGWDILSNVASEVGFFSFSLHRAQFSLMPTSMSIYERPLLRRLLLSALRSANKNHVVRACETIGELCRYDSQDDENAEWLCETV